MAQWACEIERPEDLRVNARHRRAFTGVRAGQRRPGQLAAVRRGGSPARPASRWSTRRPARSGDPTGMARRIAFLKHRETPGKTTPFARPTIAPTPTGSPPESLPLNEEGQRCLMSVRSLPARCAVFFVAAAFAVVASVPAQAAAPMVKTQAPGYYRMMLGGFEVTALNDGFFDLPVDKLLKQPPEKTDAALARSFLKPPVETSVNAFLINTGTKLVLVDTGHRRAERGQRRRVVGQPASGRLQARTGRRHRHHAHATATMSAASRTPAPRCSPNAVVHACKADADYWLDPANMDKAPDSAKGNFRTAVASLGAVRRGASVPADRGRRRGPCPASAAWPRRGTRRGTPATSSRARGRPGS